MIDIKLIRENRDVVKGNIKKKFQDEKLELVLKFMILMLNIVNIKTKAIILEARRKNCRPQLGL